MLSMMIGNSDITYQMMDRSLLSTQREGIKQFNWTRFYHIKTGLLTISYVSLIMFIIIACINLTDLATTSEEDFEGKNIDKNEFVAFEAAIYGSLILVSLLPIIVIHYEVYCLVMTFAVLQFVGLILWPVMFGMSFKSFLLFLYNILVCVMFFYFAEMLQQKRMLTRAQIPL